MAGGHVHGNGRVAARSDPRPFHGLHHQFEALLVGSQGRGVPSLVRRPGAVDAARLTRLFRAPVNRRHVSQRLRIAGGAQRNDLVILKVYIASTVNSAAHDIDHRNGELRRPASPR